MLYIISLVYFSLGNSVTMYTFVITVYYLVFHSEFNKSSQTLYDKIKKSADHLFEKNFWK